LYFNNQKERKGGEIMEKDMIKVVIQVPVGMRDLEDIKTYFISHILDIVGIDYVIYDAKKWKGDWNETK
jgi:hypothetical protein